MELKLDLKSPELELKSLESELEMKLILSSGIGIGIENNGTGIELKKWNWPQPWWWNQKIWLFKVKFDLEGHGQLLPKTTGILTKVFCISGPNLVILTWTGDELWCGKAQNGVNFDFKS